MNVLVNHYCIMVHVATSLIYKSGVPTCSNDAALHAINTLTNCQINVRPIALATNCAFTPLPTAQIHAIPGDTSYFCLVTRGAEQMAQLHYNKYQNSTSLRNSLAQQCVHMKHVLEIVSVGTK